MTGETQLSFASLVENNSLKSNPNLAVFCSLFLLPSGIVFHCPFFLDFQGVSNDDCLHEPFPKKTLMTYRQNRLNNFQEILYVNYNNCTLRLHILPSFMTVGKGLIHVS